MPRDKKQLPIFHDASNALCPKCGGQKPSIKYCSTCPQVDRHYISGEHIHIRCGVCLYEADVMNTMENNMIDEPDRIDLEKDGA